MQAGTQEQAGVQVSISNTIGSLRFLGSMDWREFVETMSVVEQTLREMRAILYQGRDTGKAVVVQPAETQGQVESLTNRVGDLEDTLRRVNGQIDQIGVDLAAIRRDSAGTVGALQAAKKEQAAQAITFIDPRSRLPQNARIFMPRESAVRRARAWWCRRLPRTCRGAQASRPSRR